MMTRSRLAAAARIRVVSASSWACPCPTVAVPACLTAVASWLVPAWKCSQTARLDLANGQKSDILAIVDQCKVRQQAVLKAILPKPPAWEVWRR